MYNDEDFQVLEIIGAQAAVSIDNAQLYSEVKEFNEKLEQKVEDATLELRSTNNELKDMNEKLVTAYEKLHQLDRAKTEFISIASHQLRTPLTSIKGFISLLLDGTYGKIKKNTQEVLEKVFISNERLIKLVEDLLNISRIESGKLVFNFSKGDITYLAKDIVESFELAAKNKKLKLEYRAPKKKVPEIFFDKDKIREVISNLIDNSIKYTKKGTVAVTVESDKDAVRVIISDTGMGIAKEELRYIFEKFQRGKDSSTTHTEGVGLGLYVCEKIIKSHEGKIWAESDGLEKGSRFIIQLNIDFQPEDQVKVIDKKVRKKN
ncbi:MAG: HAMP domain-containing sensor histidine kinase [Patescibacteria group bacterium]|jgi:signal transduction histidine kinase|nr:HAMP domain-containing sensor histidine kinase [Patescibacteria group bacterium]